MRQSFIDQEAEQWSEPPQADSKLSRFFAAEPPPRIQPQPQPPPKRERTRLGRNDPCPCGSGKKFKRCHYKPAINVSIVSRGEQP